MPRAARPTRQYVAVLVLRKAWPTSSTLPECLFSEDAAASSLIGGNRKLRNVRTRALLVSGVRTIRLAQTPTGQQGRTRAGHIRPLWFAKPTMFFFLCCPLLPIDIRLQARTLGC